MCFRRDHDAGGNGFDDGDGINDDGVSDVDDDGGRCEQHHIKEL